MQYAIDMQITNWQTKCNKNTINVFLLCFIYNNMKFVCLFNSYP